MSKLAISTAEWKEKCNLTEPATERRLPDCSELFQKFYTVAGQKMTCPPIWVSLVECLGIFLDITPHSHPPWEQNDNIRPISRYYPTMMLFVVHNYTALRRLEAVTSISDSDMSEVTRILSTPVRNADGEILVTEGTVLELCGEPAASLFRFVENLVFECTESSNIIGTVRFRFALLCEDTQLHCLLKAYKLLDEQNSASHQCSMKLLPLMSRQEAARHSLSDVVFPSVWDIMDIGHVEEDIPGSKKEFNEPAAVTTALLKAVLLLVLGSEIDSSTFSESTDTGQVANSNVQPQQSHTDLDACHTPQYRTIKLPSITGYSKPNMANLIPNTTFSYLENSLTPQQRAETAIKEAGGIKNLSPKELCEGVFTGDGCIHTYIKDFVPTYGSLMTTVDNVRDFVAASDAFIRSQLPEWKQRKWESILSINTLKKTETPNNPKGLQGLLKLAMWLSDTMNTWNAIVGLRQATDSATVAEERVYGQIESLIDYKEVRLTAQRTVEKQSVKRKEGRLQIKQTNGTLEVTLRDDVTDEVVVVTSSVLTSAAKHQRLQSSEAGSDTDSLHSSNDEHHLLL